MSKFQIRLFFRIVARNRQVYFLKIVTLAAAFACATLVVLFSINEFGFDRFHKDYRSIFRVLEKNENESYSGNRLSNKISEEAVSALASIGQDSIVLARVKLMTQLNSYSDNRTVIGSKLYAASPSIVDIFSFEVIDGSLAEFKRNSNGILLSSSQSVQYFHSTSSVGKELRFFSFGDTITGRVVAVFKDFPNNSHESFDTFIRFDSSTVEALNFNPAEVAIYGRVLQGDVSSHEVSVNIATPQAGVTYRLQPLSEIYFGPRVLGEDAKHGDYYSIIILVCIASLILFLAVTSFTNLTTLTLPYRSKELALKKLVGTSQTTLTLTFIKESCLVVGISFLLGLIVLVFSSSLIEPLLAINIIALFRKADLQLFAVLLSLFTLVVIAPVFMTFRFTSASPNRLLSSETITFPLIKNVIMFLQLGISIFLIVASMVVNRQINYSLLKEPGRNHDQVVYVRYPKDLTNEGLVNLRSGWKKIHPNILDVMATSQLPDRISSRQIDSEFFFMSVDRGFKDFFDLKIVNGNWFGVNDNDSAMVVNEAGSKILSDAGSQPTGVFEDISGQFNQPSKPIKLNVAAYYDYNFLCIRILEVDIRRTVNFLQDYFAEGSKKTSVFFLNKRFEEWLVYQDRLNALSSVLAILSILLSCGAIYGLSISIVREKLKQIAIHKLCGADTVSIIGLLARQFARQMGLAILIFGPLTYLVLTEILRGFVYSTHFQWTDPLVPLVYCFVTITLLCGFQTLTLNREDLSSALKG